MADVLEAIITPALQDLGVLAAVETPTAADSALGLRKLNILIDQWAAERLQIFTVTRTTWALTPGQSVYSVGPGQTVNIPRPTFVQDIHYLRTDLTPVLEQTMEPLTEDAFAQLRQKGYSSPFPTRWYYNPTFPNATLTLWPVPTDGSLQGVIYAPTAVARFATIHDTVSLPPGYERMMVSNLALEMAPAFEVQPNPALVASARDSLAAVKRKNVRPFELYFEPSALIDGATAHGYDILIGP